MKWNLVGEWTSLVYLIVLMVYAYKGSYLQGLRNSIFKAAGITSIIIIISNLSSSYMIALFKVSPEWLVHLTLLLNFASTSFFALIILIYIMLAIYPKHTFTKMELRIIFSPFVVYIVFLLTNFLTGFIYNFDRVVGYSRGSIFYLNYLTYIFAAVILIYSLIRYRSIIEKRVYMTMFSLPFLVLALVIVQFLFPKVILTGTSSAVTILVLYLYFQNKGVHTDVLTGIENRKSFTSAVESNISSNKKFTVLVLSIRDFKTVNDRFGHRYGDELLNMFARYLVSISSPNRVFRYAGDIFTVIIEENEVSVIAEYVSSVKRRVTQPWIINKFSNYINIAMSSVEYPNIAESLEEITSGMEFSLAQVKKNSGTLYTECSMEMMDLYKRKSFIVEILKDFIENDKFDIEYQPIWDVNKNRYVKAEALLRLNDTPLGRLTPDEFIPVAEEAGLIVDITYMVLDKVCKFINSIPDKEGYHLGQVSMNFSAVQFTQNDLSEKVLDIIRRNGTDPRRIKIEITESSLAENPVLLTKFMKEMHSVGIGFSLDDYGTGYSNATAILSLPLETIKIDKSIVWMGYEKGRDNSFMEHLIGSFISMGFTIVAEGIESKEMSSFMESYGCNMMQGFYYSKPLPKEELLNIIEDLNSKIEQEGDSYK